MNEIKTILENYVTETIKLLVDHKNEIMVNCSISTKAVIIQIKVNQSDCGKVIGKQGRIIDALKLLCFAIKNTQNPDDIRRIVLEVLEDDNSDYINLKKLGRK